SLTAATFDANGNQLTGRSVSWTTGASSIATVATSGVVTAVAVGKATIYATSEGQSDSSVVTVTQAPVATVSVSPTTASLVTGGKEQLSATLRDAGGNVLTGRTITWSTSSAGAATVSNTGLVTAVGAGSATITATSEGQHGTSAITVTSAPATVASVTVSPSSDSITVGGTQQFTATVKDSAGNVLTGRPVTWGTSNAAVATVSTSGLVTAEQVGSATITATSQGKSGGAAVTVPAVSSGTHSGWYASPTGSSGASGTASAPWDLATALGGGHGKVQPGDTIWLRGGTYGAGDNSTVYTSALTGTSTQPIIVRQYPGERATLNANLAVNGAYTWYMDFEVANTQTGPQSINGISHAGLGTKLIDLVVHDHTGNGIFTSEAAANSEIYGCLLYNNGSLGQSAADRAHGIYAQNLSGTKVLRDNIIFQTYAFGIHVYGQGGHLNNITVDGNVLFNNGMFNSNNFFLGGGQALVNLRFTNNMTYGVGGTGIIGEGTTSSGGVITGNYFVGPLLTITDWASLTFQHNTFTQPNPWEIIVLNAPSKATLANYQWSDNTYYRLNTSGLPFTFQDHSLGTSTAYSFAGWQGLGIDAGSGYSEMQKPPMKVVVEPDQYEAGRAIVVVYNWSGQG